MIDGVYRDFMGLDAIDFNDKLNIGVKNPV